MTKVKALIDGHWHGNLDVNDPKAQSLYQRKTYPGGHVIAGTIGLNVDGEPLAPDLGRYHLYGSFACPYAQRSFIARRLSGLDDLLSVSILHPRWATDHGWQFGDSDDSTVDHVDGDLYLYQKYQQDNPRATTRVTVPVLWDKQRGRIVSKESADIVRMLNTAFRDQVPPRIDLYPEALRGEIDTLNAEMLPKLCNGVYAAGFAQCQSDYDQAVAEVFEHLDSLERRLTGHSFLHGDVITESDVFLFCTLVRFDVVYHGSLKCNLRRLIDYPALSNFARRLFEISDFQDTTNLDHVTRHYHDDTGEADPRIIPIGPAVDFRTARSQ